MKKAIQNLSTPENRAFWTKSPEAEAIEQWPEWRRAGVKTNEKSPSTSAGAREYWLEVEAVELLRKAAPHVFRQQHAGKHKQDRIDAQELMPQIDGFLKRLDPSV